MTLEKLVRIVTPAVEGGDTFREWSEQTILFDLLAEQRQGSPTILYATSFNHGSLLLDSILVPSEDIETADPDEMTRWSRAFGSGSCGLTYGGGQPPRVEYSAPLAVSDPAAFRRGTQLVFGRDFSGRAVDKNYFEIAQSLIHPHNLHWVPERRAWCRFDERGDVENVILWSEHDGRAGYGSGSCITIDRELLEMHMSATGTALVQMFDVTSVGVGFAGWNQYNAQLIEEKQNGLFFRLHKEGTNGSWSRGVQIIRPRMTAEEYGQYLYDKDRSPKEYATFITQDCKNKRIVEVSCAPEAMASYFVPDSPLPFEVSPVFFRPEVLDRYKADTEKFTLRHRSITCRNSWHLQSYDVNAAGQIHTYLKYLGDLPFDEQLYWKSFNVKPQGGISEWAFTTDFKGEWSDHYDPLQDLKTFVLELHEAAPPWFKLREPVLVEQLHYPLTSSGKAWNDSLIGLAKVVVESLEKGFFEKLAKGRGAVGEPLWGSVKWAQEAFRVFGFSDEESGEVISPLRRVQELRTKLAAHTGGSSAADIRAELLREHKTPRSHIEKLSDELLRSLRILQEIEWI